MASSYDGSLWMSIIPGPDGNPIPRTDWDGDGD
ncbi:hypothetical protein CCACVL1_12458 [Corchorus capsularis]|uniref:Uncharacterized protein n=1 Tax=Corchorus capsularis TaxID=210143 RepID=A0A1R3IFS1_COCAP|nr:hypothetical protein CCACVL1_12458 [Corchorus capsularis]